MSLRIRLAILFALVALVAAAAVVVSAPAIVARAIAAVAAENGVTPGAGAGGRFGQGPMGPHALEVQQETILTIVIVAAAGAVVASLLGWLLATRITRPLGDLEEAAAAVAHGDLARRSGLGERGDEIGSLGRSFDAMAGSLEQAEAARRRFFQDAAHEMKTPLAVIGATANAVLDGVYTHDDRHLVTIRDQAALLARLVDDLRTIGLAEAGALALHPHRVPAADILEAAARDFSARAALAQVEIEVAGGGTAGDAARLVVDGDPDRVRQILAALLDNALRVTPPGGRILLEAGEAEAHGGGSGHVRLAVQDSGPGVPPEHLPHLFDRFYQADAARDRATGTSGLGLSIVKALSEAHGGRAGAENVAGGGARFWVELPEGPARTEDGSAG